MRQPLLGYGAKPNLPAFVERNSPAQLWACPQQWVMSCGRRRGNGSAPGMGGLGELPAVVGAVYQSTVLATADIRNCSTTSAPSTATSTEYADIGYSGLPVNSRVSVIILCSNRFRSQPLQIADHHLGADASD
jgi:hypothetical protein